MQYILYSYCSLTNSIRPRKWLLFCVAAVLAVGISGCGGYGPLTSWTVPFKEAVDGPIARLRIVSDGAVKGIPSTSCIDWNLPGAGVLTMPTQMMPNINDRSLTGRKLDLPSSRFAPPANARWTTEVHIQAGKPLLIGYSVEGASIYSCNNAWTFVPDEGKDYEAVFWQVGNQCRVELRSLDGGLVPTVSRAHAC